MNVGYVRVSTAEQNEARQLETMKQRGIEKVFIDKCSGKNTDRPQLQAMLAFVRDGDTVTVDSFSRLARSTKDLLQIVATLQDRGAQLVSVKENLDTSTPQGRLMLTMFGALAEFEREQMLERQREGVAIAKAAGKYKGRQPIQIDEQRFRERAKHWQAGKITAAALMREFELKPNTFYRRCAEWGITPNGKNKKED